MAIFKKVLIILAILFLPIIGYIGFFDFKSTEERKQIEVQRKQDEQILQVRMSQIPPNADKIAIQSWFDKQDNLGYEITVINETNFALKKTYHYQYNLVCGSWTDIIELTTNENHQIISRKNNGFGSCL